MIETMFERYEVEVRDVEILEYVSLLLLFLICLLDFLFLILHDCHYLRYFLKDVKAAQSSAALEKTPKDSEQPY